MKKKKILLSWLIVCCLAICITGCGTGTNEDPIPETETAKTDKSESVYQDSLEKTFCIYTPSGNNGTGFLYKEKYVITNAHVLSDADDFTLMDINEKEYEGAVVFSDNETDIAIIRIDDYHGKSVQFGDSDAVAVGEQLVFIGNPFDGEPFDLRTGERVELDESFQQSIDSKERFIPTDAGIVSGFSGGPVFNLRGELIGISNAAYVGDLSEYEFEHLSLIIPINRVKEQIETNCID